MAAFGQDLKLDAADAEQQLGLPAVAQRHTRTRRRVGLAAVWLLALLVQSHLLGVISWPSWPRFPWPWPWGRKHNSPYAPGSFYLTKTAVHLSEPKLCAVGKSYSGHIGVTGDEPDSPRRIYYWFFEAQVAPETAPVIMTFGGGPGTSGMSNPMVGQSHCVVAENGTTLIPHDNAWSEHFNLLAIDHPIGVGFSYGKGVNNSRDAAFDVYDFLQKFYVTFPQYSTNNFVVASGSYGGTYVPHVGTVINEQNKLVAAGRGVPGAQRIPLESLMISNPYSDPLSYYRWFLHQRCYNTDLYNSTTCTELYKVVPQCLEEVEFALENPLVPNKLAALKTCDVLREGDMHGRAQENVKLECDGSVEDCLPMFTWISSFFNNATHKAALGVPEDLSFQSLSNDVYLDFRRSGDLLQPVHLLYEPLLEDGIRVLHYVGMLDCNCGWPATFSFLKLLKTHFQNDFIAASDVPWPTTDIATVRAIGAGAGNMTFVLMAEAGHMVTLDQPALVKSIVERWVTNTPWFE
ncbi:alpha/beta-hydrolase [Exidia glandulosa HHB12029]|uniref:Alpha/beta-hydrolase n=1 Tax=Exidia glandulosa HHB12029 TaxID=1314781 RepID=A0A166MY08_EXIGL|nr:alpha/beta-hydrolase [Exidia glandulosa HHB12029]